MTIAALVAGVVVLAADMALPQDRDPRCNTAARYDAMRAGANCSGSEAWPAPKKPKSKPKN